MSIMTSILTIYKFCFKLIFGCILRSTKYPIYDYFSDFWKVIIPQSQSPNCKVWPRRERVPSAEILAEFLSAHFQENPTKSAYFWWTNDLFCLLRVGPCEKLWKCHLRPSRDSKFSKFSQMPFCLHFCATAYEKSSTCKNNTLQSQSGAGCIKFLITFLITIL
jgi:hypothetical protein